MILARIMGSEELMKFKKGEVIRPLSKKEFREKYPDALYEPSWMFSRKKSCFMDWSTKKLTEQSMKIARQIFAGRVMDKKYGEEKAFLVLFRTKKHYPLSRATYYFETRDYGDPETGWRAQYCFEAQLAQYSKQDMTIFEVYALKADWKHFKKVMNAAIRKSGYQNVNETTNSYQWERWHYHGTGVTGPTRHELCAKPKCL